jgi:hypothetical protein
VTSPEVMYQVEPDDVRVDPRIKRHRTLEKTTPIEMPRKDWVLFWAVLTGCMVVVFSAAFAYIWLCLWIAGVGG